MPTLRNSTSRAPVLRPSATAASRTPPSRGEPSRATRIFFIGVLSMGDVAKARPLSRGERTVLYGLSLFESIGRFAYRRRFLVLVVAAAWFAGALVLLVRGGRLSTGTIHDLEAERAGILADR